MAFEILTQPERTFPPSGFTVRRERMGIHWILSFERKGVVHHRVPAMIGQRYRIDDVLSDSGGFGVIFRARDVELDNRLCLVKANKYDPRLIERAARGDPKELNRLREAMENECLYLIRMQERGEGRVPNILRLLEDVQPALIPYSAHLEPDLLDREPYLVLQFIPGHTLKAEIQDAVSDQATRFSPTWWRKALQWTRELCSILTAIHKTEKARRDDRDVQEGFLYVDLKPSNCIVSRGEFIHLIDFGGVRPFWRPIGEASDTDWITTPGAVFSPGYVAPEVLLDEYERRLDPRVDLYSISAVLWYMLTGVDPAELATAQMPSVHLRVDDTRLPPRLPGEITEILTRGLARDRRHRPSSGGELRELVIQALKVV